MTAKTAQRVGKGREGSAEGAHGTLPPKLLPGVCRPKGTAMQCHVGGRKVPSKHGTPCQRPPPLAS